MLIRAAAPYLVGKGEEEDIYIYNIYILYIYIYIYIYIYAQFAWLSDGPLQSKILATPLSPSVAVQVNSERQL